MSVEDMSDFLKAILADHLCNTEERQCVWDEQEMHTIDNIITALKAGQAIADAFYIRCGHAAVLDQWDAATKDNTFDADVDEFLKKHETLIDKLDDKKDI